MSMSKSRPWPWPLVLGTAGPTMAARGVWSAQCYSSFVALINRATWQYRRLRDGNGGTTKNGRSMGGLEMGTSVKGLATPIDGPERCCSLLP